jgi:hypothetical protein
LVVTSDLRLLLGRGEGEGDFSGQIFMIICSGYNLEFVSPHAEKAFGRPGQVLKIDDVTRETLRSSYCLAPDDMFASKYQEAKSFTLYGTGKY